MPPPYLRPRLTVDPGNQARLRRELTLDTTLPVIALMPGAEYGPAKQWPLAHFAELARRLIESGRQVWILGSAKDRAAGETIARQAGAGVRNLCGQTRLEDAVDLLALAQAAVTNDSGLMHVAAALDVPTIALFGSSSPAHTPPLSERAKVLYLGLDCSPCFKRVCPLGHTRCLENIHPQRVIDTLGCYL
jgi:heptosyltransferase-2